LYTSGDKQWARRSMAKGGMNMSVGCLSNVRPLSAQLSKAKQKMSRPSLSACPPSYRRPHMYIHTYIHTYIHRRCRIQSVHLSAHLAKATHVHRRCHDPVRPTYVRRARDRSSAAKASDTACSLNQGRCYDHNFLRFSSIFGEKNWRFS
jgi:hypothetical protein